MANKCGHFRSPLRALFPAQRSSFPGPSTIVDGDGVFQGRLGSAEGIIVADVHIDPGAKSRPDRAPLAGGPCRNPGRHSYGTGRKKWENTPMQKILDANDGQRQFPSARAERIAGVRDSQYWVESDACCR